MDKQVQIKVGEWDCRSFDGDARGRRYLVEGVGDAVHGTAKIALGRTLPAPSIALPLGSNMWELDLTWGTCG